jgi:hypothetical protein
MVSGVVLLWNILVVGQIGAQASDWFGVVMGASSFAATGACFGLVWSLFVAAVTGPVVYFVARFVGYRGSILWLGAFWGGLVGFVCALPVPAMAFAMPIATRQSDAIGYVLVGIAIGPAMTTILGQIGGAAGAMNAIGNYRKKQRNRLGRWIALHLDNTSAQESDLLDGLEAPVETRLQPPVRFGIRHLLWITLWLSLVLTAIRLSGLPTEFVVPLLVAWLVFQAATLWLGSWAATRFQAWWERRAFGREEK